MKKFVIACALVVAYMGSAFANGSVEEKKVEGKKEGENVVLCCKQANVVSGGYTASFNTCAETCRQASIDLGANISAWLLEIN